MKYWITSTILLIGILYSCQNTGVRVSDFSFQQLSDYQLFTNELNDLSPNEGVLPYDLITPLFSDYAHKSRFVWMPEGSAANYMENDVLDFPINTLLIKTFFYQNDARLSESRSQKDDKRRLIETRILKNSGEQWEAYNYIWNDEQTEAYLDVVGDIKDITWINTAGNEMKVDYIIPNKNQCKACHSNKGIQKPIGPKVRNLNKDFAYADGVKNQLQKWVDVGYLKGYDLEMPHAEVAKWNDPNEDLHQRAMAYLDVNCAHCHNPDGPANTSGLNLDYGAESELEIGVWKSTVAAGAGTGGRAYNIVPGRPDESIFTYRMASTNPAEMMPELGRRLVHEEGLALIEEWISGM